MPPKRRRLERPFGERRYKKLFVVSVAGIRTEPQYFAVFSDQHAIVKVECLKGNGGSSPYYVLKRMKSRLTEESLRSSDEAWLVVDKDDWTDEQLVSLHQWSLSRHNYSLALSNPSFEYWLLLHFENGNGVTGRRDCLNRLTRYLPDYDKSIDPRQITADGIAAALRRAKQRDNPPCADWPREIGTTVYRLVERILEA